MNIFFLSEHYLPRIGGVTSYVRETCVHFAALGHNVNLVVPGENPYGTISYPKDNIQYQEIFIGVGTSLSGNILAEARKQFISQAEVLLREEYLNKNVDVIHVLFGMYIMQFFDFTFFKNNNIPVGVTIHNIPPAECSTSWKGDLFSRYIKDKVRMLGVGFVNRRRIRNQSFDYYITPSEHVRSLLIPLVSNSKITVIGHGISPIGYFEKEVNRHSSKIKILMVGGFVPHKRQDYIIDIAFSLKHKGLNIEWTLVGPIRNETYFKFVKSKVDSNQLQNVIIKSYVSDEELTSLYKKSDIYVQPSSEEGFCMTVLDAAAYGLPIVGTKTGAIPEIINYGSGLVSGFDKKELEASVEMIIRNLSIYKKEALNNVNHVVHHFSWELAVVNLENIILKQRSGI